jgi:ribosomal protein S6--L-glutamate ligase
MKIGIISLGGKTSLALIEECKRYFGEVHHLNLKNFKVKLTEEGIDVTYGDEKLQEYDCLYVRGSYKYSLLQRTITRALNKKVYMPICPEAFTIGHDKFLTLLELQKQKVQIPKTYYSATINLAKEILEEVNYPIILKIPEGTHGKGVLIAESLKSAKTILDTFGDMNKNIIIQEFVQTENTSDIRVIVGGNKVLASYQRVAGESEIRTNIHSGGTRKEYSLSKEEEKLAVMSAKAIGADISGVDILNAKIPSVIEINLSPSLYAISDVTKKNVLREVAKVLYNSTVKFKEKKDNKLKEKILKKNGRNGKKKKEKEKTKNLLGRIKKIRKHIIPQNPAFLFSIN